MSDSDSQSFFVHLEAIDGGFARLSVEGTQVMLPSYLLPAGAQPGDGLRATLTVDSDALQEQERTTSSIIRDRKDGSDPPAD